MNSMVKDNNKNLQIQVLRTVFCFLIIFFHFTIQYNNYYDCNNIFINPFVDCLDDVGVLSFFILSGFYLTRRKELTTFKEKLIYWIKRFLNIYLLYLAAIIIIYTASKFGYLGNRAVSLSDFFQNIVFVNVLTHSKSVDGSHWYVLALLCLYFLEFIRDILPLKKEKSAYYWIIFLVVSIPSFIIQRNINENTIPSFIFKIVNVFLCQGYYAYAFIGISLFLFDYDKPLCLKNVLLSICVVLIFVFVAIVDWKRVIVLLVTVPIIILALFRKLVFLEYIKPLIFLGNASYSIYLLHQNIGFMLLNAFVPLIGYYLSLVIVVALVFGIGILFYLLVETNTKKLIAFSFSFRIKQQKE